MPSPARRRTCRAAESARIVRVRYLATLCGKAAPVQLAILPARFYPHSSYDALAERMSWSSRVRLYHHTVCELQWWSALPECWNGRLTKLPSAEAEMAVDRSSFGCCA